MAHYEDIIVLQNSGVKCILCKELIPDNNECIKSHLNCDRHRNFYLKRLILQNSIKVNTTNIYCNICKLNIEELSYILSHINNAKHLSVLNALKHGIEQDGAFLALPENLGDSDIPLCLICDQTIEFTFEGVNDHLKTASHRRARSIAVQPYNGIFSVENSDDDLWCKICQVFFENYIEVIFEHVDEDKEHQASLNKLLYLIDGQNITIEKYLTDPKEDKAFCRKCNMEVSCNVLNESYRNKNSNLTFHQLVVIKKKHISILLYLILN